MTYRERITIEHPECVDPKFAGGVNGCPGNYWQAGNQAKFHECGGYKCMTKKDFLGIDRECRLCWDMNAPPRKVKVRKIMTTYKGEEEIIESTTQKSTVRVYQEIETIEDCTVQILKDPVTGEESVGWWRK